MKLSPTLTIGKALTVNRLGFGAMQVTGPGVWGEPADRPAAIKVLKRAIELGVDFIDTADAYGPEISEQIIAEALAPYAEGLVIATKGGLVRPGPGNWQPDGSPEHLREALDASLKRLHLDRIDVYQYHMPDPKVPFKESIQALAELQAAGKIRHIGLCNVDLDQLATARGLVDVVSVQNRYNLADRASEAVLEQCEADGIAFIPWFPLGTGQLIAPNSPLAHEAQSMGVTPAALAIAWLLHRSPVMLPIAGTSSVAHLEENLKAADIDISDEQMTKIESLYPQELEERPENF